MGKHVDPSRLEDSLPPRGWVSHSHRRVDRSVSYRVDPVVLGLTGIHPAKVARLFREHVRGER